MGRVGELNLIKSHGEAFKIMKVYTNLLLQASSNLDRYKNI